jgi:4-amino-4-deoxy-L-arabinose transferase-like glycosyltransferase
MDTTAPSRSAKILIVLLFLVWMLPGLVGRDPWKADEPYTFGIVRHMLQTGEWTVPNVAGEPFLEKPPLYFVSAALTGKLLSPPFALPDAIRFVNVGWIFLTLLFLALAAKELAGPRAAWNAAVLLMGCVILQVTAHKMVTDVALFCGFAVALYGLALVGRSPRQGGLWTGTGFGIGFMAKGLLAPGIIGIVILLLPLLFPEWRRKERVKAIVPALLAALPWLVIWPALLYFQSRAYFLEWFWYQNLGRFLGFARIMKPDSHWYYLANLPWHGLPVLPLAAWVLWKRRGRRRVDPLFQLPLVTFVVMLVVLSASASNRDLYALPLILPLTLVASAASDHLSERALSFIDRASVAFFGLLGAVLWAGLLAFLFGSRTVRGLLPPETLHYQPLDLRLLGAALVVTLFWLIVIGRTLLQKGPLLLSWTAGIALVWGLVMTLWLPWLEAEASYRGIFTSLRQGLPETYHCVASLGMGESERAMIEYYAGIQVLPLEGHREQRCDLLLIGLEKRYVDTDKRPAWTVLWEGGRPADRPKEHYTLYRTAPPGDREPPALSTGMITLKGF